MLLLRLIKNTVFASSISPCQSVGSYTIRIFLLTAYILDELAFEYDLLIFISVGNLSVEDIEEMQNVAAELGTSQKVKQFFAVS